MYSALFFAFLASRVAATPAAAGDLPCPTGFKQYKLNFDDLGPYTSGATHDVNTTASDPNDYGWLWWDPYVWQIATKGPAIVANSFHDPPVIDITTHQGPGAMITTQETAVIAPVSEQQHMNLQSFWIRHQHPGAFKLEVDCNIWVEQPQGHWLYRKAIVNIPERNAGEYYKVQLTAAQQKSLANAAHCEMYVTPRTACEPHKDAPLPCFLDKALMIDDLHYCMKLASWQTS